RLMDLFGRGKILLTGCELLVIDEADRMLDMGFIPDIEFISEKLPTTRQTLLFSATMPPPIKKLADRFLSNPKYIEVARPATGNVEKLTGLSIAVFELGEGAPEERKPERTKSEPRERAAERPRRESRAREERAPEKPPAPKPEARKAEEPRKSEEPRKTEAPRK